MRIDADWLRHPGTVAVMEMLEAAGQQAYFVGGCVRNSALGAPVADIDVASDARPDRVMALAEAAGLKSIGTGIDHGTVTVVAEGLAHEVTTFRRDVETDGRRAVVAFSDDMAEDAMRRDFTMNALYARGDGVVLDPTGQGIDDLQARQVRFIGQAEDRIREDYLRILRFFRFHAWYAAPGFEAETLAPISSLSSGLETISRERIGHEMRKLLAAPEASPALGAMAQTGVLRYVLPGADVTSEAQLEEVERRLGFAPGWPRRLAALGGDDAAESLRLSKREAAALGLSRDGVGSGEGAGAMAYRHGETLARDVLLLRAALLQIEPTARDFELARIGAQAVFPVKARDLPALKGPALGAELRRLEARWIASDFTPGRDDLLS